MEFRAERAKGEDSLHALRRALIEHEAERDDFRTRHRLRRPARTHSPAVAFLKWGILVLLLAVECAVNGSFLAKSNELGWIGGISEALAFAALNVGGAFAAATLGARLLTHRNWFLKCVGAVGVAVWLCLTLLLNLALAHYREVAGTLVSQGGQEVISRLRATPFELGDIQSWILFGIGALFAVAAFVDSLLLYDPYWGYGSLERRLSKAREQYKALKADLVDDLRDIYSDYSQKLGEIGQDLSARLGEYDRIVSARNGKLELFGAHQGQLENASNTLLGIYRSARGIHGNNLYKLARINVMVDNPDKRQRDEIERTVRDAQAVLRTQAGLLQRECQAGIERYDQIDSLVGNRKERNDASA